MLDYTQMSHKETGFMVTLLEELNLSLDDEIKWINKTLTSPDDLAIVAEFGGKIIGIIDFQGRSQRKRLAHTGHFSMALYPDFRNDGIGALLIQALLGWAEIHPTLEKVGLAVFATNLRAIFLYKKLGFLEEGRRHKEIKFGPNEYVDDILMYKLVK